MRRRLAVTAALLAALVASGRSRAEADTGKVTAVAIVSRVGDRGVADDQPKRARASDGVTLYAVIVARVAGETRYYSEAGTIRLGKRKLSARPLAEAPRAALRWYRVEPAVASMSNTASGDFRFEAIDYQETAIAAWRGAGSAAADVHPTLTPDHGDGIGTMRFKLVADTDSGTLASPGAEARRGRGSGGLVDAVHRVSLRRDDSYLGYLGELYGQPYIWASAGTSDRQHQSERLEGSDCADFVIYGRRRLGEHRPYSWTGALPKETTLLGRGQAGDDGIYRDARGEAVPFPAVGDILLFPRHVGVVSQDRGVPGVLDHADIMMHSYFDTPREQAIGDSDYAWSKVEVRRWSAGRHSR